MSRWEPADRRAWALFALVAVALGHRLLLGEVLYYGDLTLQFHPWRTYARTWLLRGILPLWLPDVYFGNPFLANDQSAVFYPFHWLTLPLSPTATLTAGFLFHLALAAAGTHAFCRRLGASPTGAAIAALSYGFGGYLVSRQQFPSLAYTIAWLPWLFWAAQRLRTERRTGLFWVAGLTAVQWFSGHAQMSVMQLTLVGLWLLAQVRSDGGRPFVAWVLATGCGTLAASVQLLPTAELLLLSPRATFDLAEATRFNLPPWQLPLLLFPKLFGTPAEPVPYLGVGPYWEVACYVGLTVAPFALAGRRQRGFWCLVGGLGLLLAFGRYSPVYGLTADLVPLLRLFHDPARFTLYAVFGAAVLAADGYDRGLTRRHLALVGGALALVLLAGLLAPVSGVATLIRAILAESPSKSIATEQLLPLAALWRESVVSGSLLAGGLLLAVATFRRQPRWLLPVIAFDLLLAGFGLNPSLPAGELQQDPRPPELRGRRLVYVPAAPLTARLAQDFSLAQYPRPAKLLALRQALPANVNVGTPLAQVAGYDPLRGAAVVAWLNETEALHPAERRARLAAVGVEGEWRDRGWTPWPEAVELQGRRPTPQRWVIAGETAATMTVPQPPFPGWVGNARRQPAATPVQSRWTDRSGRALRLRYEPLSVRLGLFASLLALALGLAAFLGGWRPVTFHSGA